MTTARDIIGDAMLEIGARASGDAIDATTAADHLRVLNRMIDSWGQDELLVYTVDRLTFNLVPSQQSYQIGVGATDFVTTYPVRPGQINMASVVVNGVEIGLDVVNDTEWRDVSVKNTPSTFPTKMWANGNYPLDVLYFWPIPSTVTQLVLYVWGQPLDFTDVNATVTLPHGYEDALVYNLGLRLCSQYGIQPAQTLVADAAKALSRIKRMNYEPEYRTVDSALGSGAASEWRSSRGMVLG